MTAREAMQLIRLRKNLVMASLMRITNVILKAETACLLLSQWQETRII
jgi:hypothetical protein